MRQVRASRSTPVWKDVNALGVCCIVAAANACQGVKIPYVLGGDGVMVAEDWVKAPNSPFCHRHSETHQASLEGFEYRWEPLRSTNGSVMSLMVIARDHAIYQRLLQFIDSLGDVEQLRPATQNNLKIASRIDRFGTEASLKTRATKGFKSDFRKLDGALRMVLDRRRRRWGLPPGVAKRQQGDLRSRRTVRWRHR
ncbi:MAG: DUF3095 family protein [Myxococcota bacterium]